MILTLDIPRELGIDLSAEAARLGLPLSEYALQILALGRTAITAPKTGAELVSYWKREGLIGTRPDIADTQKHARKVRKLAQRRIRK